MDCQKCGAQNADDANSCMSCGSALTGDAVPSGAEALPGHNPGLPPASDSTTTGWKPVGSDGSRELRTEVLRSRPGDLEVVAAITRFGAVLMTDVFHDRLVGHVSA